MSQENKIKENDNKVRAEKNKKRIINSKPSTKYKGVNLPKPKPKPRPKTEEESRIAKEKVDKKRYKDSQDKFEKDMEEQNKQVKASMQKPKSNNILQFVISVAIILAILIVGVST